MREQAKSTGSPGEGLSRHREHFAEGLRLAHNTEHSKNDKELVWLPQGERGEGGKRQSRAQVRD